MAKEVGRRMMQAEIVEVAKRKEPNYNRLPNDSRQPEILESHIRDLAALFVRNRVHGIFRRTFCSCSLGLPENTVLLGANHEMPRCRWAKATAFRAIDLGNVHGHIFVLTDRGFRPYEYQTGPIPDLSQVDEAFLQELANFLKANNLATLVGLQVIDPYPTQMLELVLPQGTIMLDVSNLNGCTPARQTRWQFGIENGEPRVCKSNETHGRHANGHDIFNAGAPHPKLETFQDIKNALVRENILCQ
ncbi:hypothetical protein V8F33_006104 [Rhypophila sp. PSN 637]